jgi:hypothetical protein
LHQLVRTVKVLVRVLVETVVLLLVVAVEVAVTHQLVETVALELFTLDTRRKG